MNHYVLLSLVNSTTLPLRFASVVCAAFVFQATRFLPPPFYVSCLLRPAPVCWDSLLPCVSRWLVVGLTVRRPGPRAWACWMGCARPIGCGKRGENVGVIMGIYVTCWSIWFLVLVTKRGKMLRWLWVNGFIWLYAVLFYGVWSAFCSWLEFKNQILVRGRFQ